MIGYRAACGLRRTGHVEGEVGAGLKGSDRVQGVDELGGVVA